MRLLVRDEANRMCSEVERTSLLKNAVHSQGDAADVERRGKMHRPSCFLACFKSLRTSSSLLSLKSSTWYLPECHNFSLQQEHVAYASTGATASSRDRCPCSSIVITLPVSSFTYVSERL